MLSEVSNRSVEGATRFIEHGKNLLGGDGDVRLPRALTLQCLLGGVSMVVVSSLGLLNVLSFFVSPSAYVIQAYLLLFGGATVVLEAGDSAPFLDTFKPVVGEWMKCLTVVGGRGVFYLFTGSIAMSLWPTCVFEAVCGAYYVVMGLLCMVVHLRVKKIIDEQESGQPGP